MSNKGVFLYFFYQIVTLQMLDKKAQAYVYLYAEICVKYMQFM